MLKEFGKFIQRGNVIDLAVGVIIGGAFGSIVKSLVNDIILPPISLLLGGVDFSNMFITLSGDSFATLAKAQEAGSITLNYGLFLNSVINFLIIAWFIFLLIKAINSFDDNEKEKAKATPPEPSAEEKLLTEIRDLLKENSA